LADNNDLIDALHKTSIDTLVGSIWPAASVANYEIVQSLWSDYGAIVRIGLNSPVSNKTPATLVAKVVTPPTSAAHPRGWNTDASKHRKLSSYQVERRFYEHYSPQCKTSCRVPSCYGAMGEGGAVTMLLEDLDTEFATRCTHLSVQNARVCLQWLAAFHTQFLGIADPQLWERGTYWHLGTRMDEFAAMPESALKRAAHQLDTLLNNCQYQTLLHGDAKVANFCFSSSGDKVAAVDFQYTGPGCGMRDVAYFLGSCLKESELIEHEADLLNTYFQTMADELTSHRPDVNAEAVEAEWRPLYAVSGADFHRFLSGWSPGHQKLTKYSQSLVTRALHIAEIHS